MLASSLKVLDRFQFDLGKAIFGPFRVFQKIVDGLFKVISFLSFLNFIADFRLCYAVPYIGYKKISLGFFGSIKIPWVSLGVFGVPPACFCYHDA